MCDEFMRNILTFSLFVCVYSELFYSHTSAHRLSSLHTNELRKMENCIVGDEKKNLYVFHTSKRQSI